MRLDDLGRWMVPGALLTGGALIAAAAIVWMVPASHEYANGVRASGEPSLYLFEGLVALGLLGLLAALFGLYQKQKRRSGRLGTIGFWIAFVGTALIFAGTVLAIGSVALRGDYQVLDGILFDGALLFWLLGFPLLGIATLRAKVFPTWVGILVLCWHLVFVSVTILIGDAAAYAVVGLLWLAIGYAMWTRQRDVSGVGEERAGSPAASGV